jgi:hypothetical protein
VFTFQLAPTASSIFRNNLLEHNGESAPGDRFALTDGHNAGGLVIVTTGDKPFRIRDDSAVVDPVRGENETRSTKSFVAFKD